MNNENLLIFFIIIFWLIDVSIQPLILFIHSTFNFIQVLIIHTEFYFFSIFLFRFLQKKIILSTLKTIIYLLVLKNK
jgi:hypothetical protein